MIVYRCVKKFMCAPLGRWLPVGARVARYENVTKLVIDEAPRTDSDPFSVLADGFIYTDGDTVTWFYGVEPPPNGTSNAGFFVRIAEKSEDQFGNVSGTAVFPPDSNVQIGTDNMMYLQNVTTSLWHQLRVNGPDGSVFIELSQNGVPAVP